MISSSSQFLCLVIIWGPGLWPSGRMWHTSELDCALLAAHLLVYRDEVYPRPVVTTTGKKVSPATDMVQQSPAVVIRAVGQATLSRGPAQSQAPTCPLQTRPARVVVVQKTYEGKSEHNFIGFSRYPSKE